MIYQEHSSLTFNDLMVNRITGEHYEKWFTLWKVVQNGSVLMVGECMVEGD